MATARERQMEEGGGAVPGDLANRVANLLTEYADVLAQMDGLPFVSRLSNVRQKEIGRTIDELNVAVFGDYEEGEHEG